MSIKYATAEQLKAQVEVSLEDALAYSAFWMGDKLVILWVSDMLEASFTIGGDYNVANLPTMEGATILRTLKREWEKMAVNLPEGVYCYPVNADGWGYKRRKMFKAIGFVSSNEVGQPMYYDPWDNPFWESDLNF